MADDSTRSRLGRGLASLIGDVGAEGAPASDRHRGQRRVPIAFLKPNPHNPRRTFSDAELAELADSIKEKGIIQPIVVRALKGAPDSYEIIAGERRWRAAQRAGLHDVPVVVLDVSDGEALELAIIENVQRADLNAIEEAGGYQKLAETYHYTQDDIAKLVGKSRSHVANTMRLLKLSDPIKTFVVKGLLTAGHARLLVGQPNAMEIAQEIIDNSLNVRQVEEMMREDAIAQVKDVRKEGRALKFGLPKDADTVALEKRLTDALGLVVTIEDRKGRGSVTIKYKDLDQLDEVVKRLERE